MLSCYSSAGSADVKGSLMQMFDSLPQLLDMLGRPQLPEHLAREHTSIHNIDAKLSESSL